MTAVLIAERLVQAQVEIAAACQRAGRQPTEVTLIVVSKTQTARQVAEAVAAGARHLGESRVDEALAKMAAVAPLVAETPQWHMIGHVQSRKARQVTDGFVLLHSLDSLRLAGRLSRALEEQDRTLDVLLEMNISGEASKEGWPALGWDRETAVRQALWADIAQVIQLPGLRVRGLMTMAPLVENPEETRPVFGGLRALRDALAGDFAAAEWHELSMGMSDDYPVAVEEGATYVRLGRAIFESRA